MEKRKAKAYNCKYFKSFGNVFGGCKHHKATMACIYLYIDDCTISERRYKTKCERIKEATQED